MGARRRAKAKYPRNYCPIDYVTAFDYDEKGRGLVHWNNKKYAVDELIIGEQAHIIIYFEDAANGEARAIELLDPSPLRALPLGHPKMQLGSYQLAHLTNQAQDAWKQTQVNKLFGDQTKPIKVGQRSFYRNKVVLSDGGFHLSGGRKKTVVPSREQFDLMEIDFDKYQHTTGDLIIRRLDQEIVGKPGEDLSTTHTFLGKIFHVNLNSFYQVNCEMMEKAYLEILDFIPSNSLVFDLFSGAATIGIHASSKAKKVFSVEINKNSHQDALKNIAANNIKNIQAINGDANLFVATCPEKADVILLDPARSGISEDSARAINNSGAKRIIYLSCNIVTQKRDVDWLTNYQVVHIQPYDFFPQTCHIENLVILDLKN